MKQGRKDIAFFDIDKTIIKINSGEALIKMAYRKGVMSTLGIVKAIYAGVQYKYSMKDTHKIIQKMGSDGLYVLFKLDLIQAEGILGNSRIVVRDGPA